MDRSNPARVALLGLPGAGKSTSAALLMSGLSELGRRVTVVKIGAPLYDMQQAFYSRLGLELPGGQQDGKLLNFFGSHFRTVAPDFLQQDFAERASGAVLGGADVLVCDDARPVDLSWLAKQGFAIVRISAPDELRRQRKQRRGDRVSGDDAHPTEANSGSEVVDHEIDNSGDLAHLGAQVDRLAKVLAAGPAAGVPLDGEQMIDALIDRASALITRRYAENRHQIGAVLLAADGRIFTGLHLEAMVGRASICAEAGALNAACETGAPELLVGLAVRHPKPSEAREQIKLVPPCGLCRELLLDYSPDIRVVVAADSGRELVPLALLLPHKYVGTKWKKRDLA